MTAREFCYWLQGKLEIDSAKLGVGDFTEALSVAQVQIIKRHLSLVFAHDIDPKAGGPEVQEKLNAIHGKNTIMRC